ncbi:hypothetical protein K469DRAFT_544115, partial [Zopfia rhizophila CBS 207.26]
DAIKITRLIGIRYLWADSLCIIQGNANDWEEQSAVLTDIYAGCYLNIETTQASCESEGFLSSRWTSGDRFDWARRSVQGMSRRHEPGEQIALIRKCVVKSLTVTDLANFDRYSQSMRVRLALNSSHEVLQTFRWIWMHKETTPLIERGSVYQERNLSPLDHPLSRQRDGSGLPFPAALRMRCIR